MYLFLSIDVAYSPAVDDVFDNEPPAARKFTVLLCVFVIVILEIFNYFLSKIILLLVPLLSDGDNSEDVENQLTHVNAPTTRCIGPKSKN